MCKNISYLLMYFLFIYFLFIELLLMILLKVLVEYKVVFCGLNENGFLMYFVILIL